MKFKHKLLTIIALGVSLSSCSFLDRTPLDQASESTFWKTEADAEKGVNALYPLLPNDRDFWRDCQSDNTLMTNSWGENGMGYISQGIHNPSTGYINEEWAYGAIYRILYFIDKLKDMEFNPDKKKQFEGEARFMLALKYFRMTRHFGDIPLIKERPIELENSQLPRSSKQDVLNYAIENINKAIEYLPATYPAEQSGRITKAAALTLKADMYLDMASYKQFHNNQNASELWAVAAETAQQVLDLNIYKLENEYSTIFLKENNNISKEVILARQYLENEITHMLPVLSSPSGTGTTGEGWASFCPTRDLVDSYECTDGKSIYESELYDPNNPWKNRDHRLTLSIMVPGLDILRPNGKYEPYMPHPSFNKPEQMNKEGGGITGYMIMKYNDMTLKKPYSCWANFSLYRYAEVLLILAEALTETNPSDPRIADAINQVRSRAGLPNINALLGDKEALRSCVSRERRLEFTFEHKRYFDILRWKIAENVLSKPGYGINKDVNLPIGDYTADKFVGQQRVFEVSKHYLWPIPQNAIDKNPNLTQNPGW